MLLLPNDAVSVPMLMELVDVKVPELISVRSALEPDVVDIANSSSMISLPVSIGSGVLMMVLLESGPLLGNDAELASVPVWRVCMESVVELYVALLISLKVSLDVLPDDSVKGRDSSIMVALWAVVTGDAASFPEDKRLLASTIVVELENKLIGESDLSLPVLVARALGEPSGSDVS